MNFDIVVVVAKSESDSCLFAQYLDEGCKSDVFGASTKIISAPAPVGVGSGGAITNGALYAAEILTAERGFDSIQSDVLDESSVLILNFSESQRLALQTAFLFSDPGKNSAADRGAGSGPGRTGRRDPAR